MTENFHSKLLKNNNLFKKTHTAIRQTIQECEDFVLDAHISDPTNSELPRAGSCLNAALILDETCFVINIGDSRSLLSAETGSKVMIVSKDHKPSDLSEIQRVAKGGGDVYISTIKQVRGLNG